MIEAMKKIGLAAAVAMIVAATPVASMAQEAAAEEASTLSASIDVPVLSAYVWRGLVLNDEGVLQPSATISKGGFSLNYWQNFALTDQSTGDEFEFSEHDVTVSYSFACPITKADITLGVVNYDFPNPSVDHEGIPSLVDDTREAFAIFGWSCPANPTIAVYYDFKEADGFYANLGVGHSVGLNDNVSLDFGANAGWADGDWNTFYFPSATEQDEEFVDANFTVALPIALNDSWTITTAAQYMMLIDNDIEDSADATYHDKEQLVGSLKASYAF